MSAENNNVEPNSEYWFLVVELGKDAMQILQNSEPRAALEKEMQDSVPDPTIEPRVFIETDRDEPNACVSMHLEAAEPRLALAEAMAICLNAICKRYLQYRIFLKQARFTTSKAFNESGLAVEDSWAVTEYFENEQFNKTTSDLVDEFNTFGTFTRLSA